MTNTSHSSPGLLFSRSLLSLQNTGYVTFTVTTVPKHPHVRDLRGTVSMASATPIKWTAGSFRPPAGAVPQQSGAGTESSVRRPGPGQRFSQCPSPGNGQGAEQRFQMPQQDSLPSLSDTVGTAHGAFPLEWMVSGDRYVPKTNADVFFPGQTTGMRARTPTATAFG